LTDYATRSDWPHHWQALRQGFSGKPNLGQWLRWEAAFAEMEAWFAVPQDFRESLLAGFAAQMPDLCAGFSNLHLMPEQCGDDGRNEELRHRTIFSFVPHWNGEALSPAQAADLYRAASDLNICQLGQPVTLRHRDGAALRLCASARMVSESWARAGSAADALAFLLGDARSVLEKLDRLIESDVR
jgi:hypothetical protein